MKRYASANLIANETLQKVKYKNLRDSIFKKLYIVVLILGVIILAESAVVGYQYTARPNFTPDELKVKFQQQQIARVEIQKKMVTFANADKERKRIMNAINTLVSTKPPDIFFTSLHVEDTGILQLDCFSQNPESFHYFVENMKMQNETFTNSKVEKITTDGPSKSYKTSQIKTDFR